MSDREAADAETERRWRMIDAAPEWSIIRMGWLNPQTYVKLPGHRIIRRLDQSEWADTSARQGVSGYAHRGAEQWRFEIAARPTGSDRSGGDQQGCPT